MTRADYRNAIADAALAVIPDDQLKLLNELLKTATPAGAYGLGTLTVAGLHSPHRPPRKLYAEVASAATVEEANALIDAWVDGRLHREAH